VRLFVKPTPRVTSPVKCEHHLVYYKAAISNLRNQWRNQPFKLFLHSTKIAAIWIFDFSAGVESYS